MGGVWAKELNPGKRILMGPGPSNVPPRVLKAMTTPLVGYLDPYLFEVMDDVCRMLRLVFQTKNRVTIPISGTGTAGMEASFANFVEPGDTVIIGVNGYFSNRMVEMAYRLGAEVIRVEAEWGRIVEPERLVRALKDNPEAKILAIVHAETSTGVEEPLAELGEACAETGALFLVDAVTSLGGMEVKVDEWKIDVCYSATQKCLGAPPGLAPLTVSEKAMHVLQSRKTKVSSWYLDLDLLMRYWGNDRVYHHTTPVTMLYALYEALRMVLEEGLEARFERHRALARILSQRLMTLGFTYFSQEGYHLPTLHATLPPKGMDVELGRKRLLQEYNIEVGGGLGLAKGKIWRIGLMGESATRENVEYLSAALDDLLKG